MDQHASDASRHDGDESPRAQRSTDADTDVFSDPSDDFTNNVAPDEQPIVADLVAETDRETVSKTSEEEQVRSGSPFAIDPFAPHAEKRIEPFHDVGPLRYTAMGAVAASIMVLAFAAVAAWWFPAGGALIAALGCALSIFGMYSSFRLASSGLLALHLGIFVLSYARSLG